jgi:hypothetical protein
MSRMMSLRVLREEAERDELFTALEQAGRIATFLYDSDVPDLAVWRNFTDPENAWCFLVRVDEAPGAAVVVNTFTGKAAMLHFCCFPEYDAHVVAMGRYVVRWLLGGGRLSALTGLTPVVYRHVLKAVREIGAVEMGRVPDACRIAGKHRCVAGVLSLYTSENLSKSMKIDSEQCSE